MPITLISLLQMVLIVLLVVMIVAFIQLILILADVRQITNKAKRVVASLNFFDCLFDAEDRRQLVRSIKKLISRILGQLAKIFNKFLGGGEKHG